MTEPFDDLDAATLGIMAAILKKTTASRDDEAVAVLEAATILRLARKHVAQANVIMDDDSVKPIRSAAHFMPGEEE